MDNETLFYICGVVLAISAVLVSFAGLKVKNFPGKALPIVVLWFAIFVGGATTFAVLHAKDEDEAKAAEFKQANEEIEAEETTEPFEEEEAEAKEGETGETKSAAGEGEAGKEPKAEEEKAGGAEGKQKAEGGAETLQLTADTTALAFDTTTLEAKAGAVTIDFDNPSAIEHDVAIEADGKELAKSETITESKTSVTAELQPGSYTFYCSVPGHREAGMEGTLTVK